MMPATPRNSNGNSTIALTVSHFNFLWKRKYITGETMSLLSSSESIKNTTVFWKALLRYYELFRRIWWVSHEEKLKHLLKASNRNIPGMRTASHHCKFSSLTCCSSVKACSEIWSGSMSLEVSQHLYNGQFMRTRHFISFFLFYFIFLLFFLLFLSISFQHHFRLATANLLSLSFSQTQDLFTQNLRR
jgi:hypothetical protein